jgi:ssDNA-binding Zn-finger/Zn-ribbon topoisomerase 1
MADNYQELEAVSFNSGTNEVVIQCPNCGSSESFKIVSVIDKNCPCCNYPNCGHNHSALKEDKGDKRKIYE